MPRLSIDYSRTLMYKIVCKDITITDTYVGHTTHFTKRKYNHNSCCNNKNSKKYNYPLYNHIRENGGWCNWDMILIEEYSCENELQAKQRERYWIETLNSNLNKIIPSRTKQEWIEEHKEEMNYYMFEYRETHRKEKNEKQNEKITCECGLSVARANLHRHQKTKKHQDYMEQKEG